MADFFVSYTKSDHEWAFWIGQELEKLGHTPHIHQWEISGGGDIAAWMEERHHDADHVLCVISKAYLAASYSSWERRAAQWAAATQRTNFVLPVFVEDCEAPTLLAHINRCDLYRLSEEQARVQLTAFLTPAGRPAGPMRFPGTPPAAPKTSIAFPGGPHALSNIPVAVPRHFLGRDDALAAIEGELFRHDGRVAITALHGMRGVGKTTLAAAYAEKHRADYRATWWIRAQTESGIRADLVALGVRLSWVAAEEKEQPAIMTVMERLRNAGEGILLIFDNAISADSLKPYLPRGGAARILVTSNAPVWRGIAAPVEILLWSSAIGADYLIARTGRAAERDASLALSEALGGLPLAHEQAAAYCERLSVPFAEYRKRFEATPVRLLDNPRDAPSEYHDGLTVAKTFALAIEEAAKAHPAAEALIVCAALLAPEPIPLFLFVEGREELGEPLAPALADDGIDEILGVLRAFALVDRETIRDERDPSIMTDCIRLHRLVRQVATARRVGEARAGAQSALVKAMVAVYPGDVFDNPKVWPQARRLDSLALALVDNDANLPEAAQENVARLLSYLEGYRHGVLGAYGLARALSERALAIRERVLGPEHPETIVNLNDLGLLLKIEGDFARARSLYERALASKEKLFGPEHEAITTNLSNLASLLRDQGYLSEARPLFERALTIREREFGFDHPRTAQSLNNLASVLQLQGNTTEAKQLFERALVIREKTLGPEHPYIASTLVNLANLLRVDGNPREALPLLERALAIDEKCYGPDHPEVATDLVHIAAVLSDQGDLEHALRCVDRSLAIFHRMVGTDHRYTRDAARMRSKILDALGRAQDATALRKS